MSEIYILVDYLNRFESKVPSIPYRSGFDKELLSQEFKALGYKVKYVGLSEVDFKTTEFRNKYVLYTSIEDSGLLYKSFIEDIVMGVSLCGGILIPRIEILRSHHNKVFMEILKCSMGIEEKIQTSFYGTYYEVLRKSNEFNYPVVIKMADGAGSRGVCLARSRKELIHTTKRISNSHYWKSFIKDKLLLIKKLLKGEAAYKTESILRRKFIVQDYIKDLSGDFKVLVFGKKFYIFERPNRKNDFRASGSGSQKYKYGTAAKIPNGIFAYAQKIYSSLNVPNLSLDIAYTNDEFYLIEFQGINFGTIGQYKSNEFFVLGDNNEFHVIKERLPLERVYAESIDLFIKSTRKDDQI
jgi:glutathione synthase/RimK-type ligase-like ATP-grasp enzyme